MRLTSYLTNSFYSEGIISAKDRTILNFGLESLLGNILSIIMILFIGSCFTSSEEALLLWLLSFPLRKNAGGYHATTKTRCFTISLGMLIISFAIFTKFEFALTFYGISAVLSGCIIWLLAPIDNLSKRLDITEYNVYRKRSRTILGIECIVIIISLYFKWKTMIRSSCMALFIVSISLLMECLKRVNKSFKEG